MKWIKKVSATPLDAIAKVIDTLQAQTNDRTNAPSIHAVNEGLANKWQDIYPVGSIYMSVNNVDPSIMFGGTWEQIKDRFLLASGNTYANGATGGEATHTLTTQEMPTHTHGITGETAPLAYPNATRQLMTGGTENFTLSDSTLELPLTVYAEASDEGGGQAHNNMPPYFAVNIWVRRA
jgi:hypothetical protein